MECLLEWRALYVVLLANFSLFGVSGHCQMGDWAKCIPGQTWRTVVSLNFYLGNTAKVKAKAGSSYWCHETGLWLNGHWHGGSWTLGCLSGCSLRDQGKPSPYSQPHSLDSRNGFDSCYNGDNNPSGSLSCSSCDDQAQGICSTDAPGQHQSHGYMLCCPFFFSISCPPFSPLFYLPLSLSLPKKTSNYYFFLTCSSCATAVPKFSISDTIT